MKRLDLAINDRAGILDIPDLTAKCNREECVSLFRSFKSYAQTGDSLFLSAPEACLFPHLVKYRRTHHPDSNALCTCFITALKEKRLSYGVSQTRLAIMAGISREHLNRIEAGKVNLTDDMQDSMRKSYQLRSCASR